MKTQEWNFDYPARQQWGHGAWQNEPDKAQWEDSATGLPCLAVRNPEMGHWCGYVGVPQAHPAYEMYDEVDVRVHGGLTYASFCQLNEEPVICHIPAPGEPDNMWWLGFDCAHVGDLVPYMEATGFQHPASSKYSGEVYRTLDYVRAECASLAQQLAAQH